MGSPLAAGTVVGDFRIGSLLGQGAMGSVYLAEEVSSGSRVALKLLAPELARDERFRQRFLRESEVAASLEHPNIVRTLAYGEEGSLLYLAMAYVEGPDLRELLRRDGRLEPARAVALVGQVAAALDAAHRAGLVHRDVKPRNILIAGDDALVCDFGLARHMSSVSSLTGERGFVGTIDYVPPEQIEGGPIDGRADVYSLGCVLYECLTGERPFDRETELAVVFAHLNEPPPRPTELRPELPAPFDSVVATALAKAASGRYGTCGEVAAAARSALHGKRRRRRKDLRLAAAAAIATAVAAGAIIGGVLLTRGSGPQETATGPPPLSVVGNALNLVEPASGRVLGHVALGARAVGTSAGFDVVTNGHDAWALVIASQRLLQIDLQTRRVSSSVRLPWVPAGRLGLGGGFVWVTQDGGHGVLGVDSRTARIERRFTIEGQLGTGIAYGAGSLWLAEDAEVARVDPRTGRLLAHIAEVPGQDAEPGWLVFADGWLWAGSNAIVRKIDPVSNTIVAKTAVPGRISDLTVDNGVWVAVTPDDLLFNLNEDDLTLEGSVSAGRDPERLSSGGGRVWLANAAGMAVSSVSEATLARTEHRLTARPQTAFADGGVLLVAATPLPTPLPPISGDEIRISTPEQVLYPEPATPRTPEDKAVAFATCANLLGFSDSAGIEGGTLRPEVAATMPKVSADGRTYTFRIRPGFRFSPPSNQPVTAETFRYSFERAFRFPDWARGDVKDIAGLSAFEAGDAVHVAGITAHGNVLRITLTEPNGAFPVLISQPEFCPVPVGTPIRPNSVARPIPRDGRYYVSSISSDRTVLLRNPNYGGDRPRLPARIVFSTGTPTSEAVSLTDHGELDFLPADGNAGALVSRGGLLDRRYGPGSAAARHGHQRYLHKLTPAWDAVVLNASRPLFRSLRMRRAVEYALDRVALARSYHDVPDGSLVPPAIAGFGRNDPYPLRGDLGRARRLAGPGHHRAVLFYCANGVFGGSGQLQPAVEIRRQLARIGIDVTITSPPCNADDRHDANSRRADLILASDYDQVLDPEGFIASTVETDYHRGLLGQGLWTGRGFRAELRRAHALRGAARLAAFRQIELELLRAAPIAVYGNWDFTVGYFSPQVGCRIIPPGIGAIDLGALCKS
jgi:ABC-type transport system substrate-binding protein/tRNA A-37 threonylcarbamoyl transferase component Bud32